MTNTDSGNSHTLNSDATYTLGRTSHETTRLIEQSKIYGESTRLLLERAGICEGMRVLEIGSGAGDVALTLAELVGSSGQVVGVDVNPAILSTARQRASETDINNIQFIAGDARTLLFEEKFDALIGRFVLMYMSDPVVALAKLITHLKPCGVVAFQEPEYTLYPGFSDPDSPLVNKLYKWIVEAFESSGAHLDMGIGLYRAFVEVGLPPPEMHLHGPIGADADWSGYRYMVTIFQSLLPLIEKFGIATAAEVDINTLGERLRQEVMATKRPFFLPLHVTAQACLPA